MNLEISLLIIFAVGFITTLIVTPFIIKRMKLQGLVGKDMNKLNKPLIAELGGIPIMLGFAFAIMAGIFLHSFLKLVDLNLTILFAGFATIFVMGFLGIIDDIIGWKKGIRQYQHALIPLVAALPLMAVGIGVTSMNIPLIGFIEFGIIYSLILVPIGVSGASNATNMLAGLNGLEAGLGILMASTMLAIAIMSNHFEAAILMIALISVLIAFLKFNWFPAKIFPGDAVTLMTGASIATAAIIMNAEKFGVLLIALFFIEFLIKAKHRFQSECFGLPQKNGTLKPSPKGGSLTHWIMSKGNFTEKQVVLIILSLQLIVCIIAFAYFYFFHYLIIHAI